MRYKRKLTSFSELAAFRHRFNENNRAEVIAQRVAHPPDRAARPGRRRPRIGFLAFALGPKAGFIAEAGISVWETTFYRGAAYIFPSRSALTRALDLALGINGHLYAIRILPTIVA